MKRLFLLLVVAFAANFAVATPSNYTINDNQIESLFNNSEQVDAASFNDMLLNASPKGVNGTYMQNGDNVVTAFVLATLLGYLGIHRAYLGTSALVIVAYIITCGGFGILTLVDWIMLLLELVDGSESSQYADNPSLFMWR